MCKSKGKKAALSNLLRVHYVPGTVKSFIESYNCNSRGVGTVILPRVGNRKLMHREVK